MNLKRNRFRPLALSLGIFLGLLAFLSATRATAQPKVDDLRIDSVNPSYGWTNEEPGVYIYINGNDFVEPLTVSLRSTALAVMQIQSNRIEAIVPSGMTPSLYDLTVETADGEVTRPAAYKVLEPTDVDDLTSFPHWLWTEPAQLRVGQTNSGVGLNVQRLGGLRSTGTLDYVTVEFVLLTEDRVLGRTVTSPLGPTFVEPTGKVIWEPEEPGQYTICAMIDPDHQIAETDENNNEICRTVMVLGEEPDLVSPVVHDFLIADGAATTAEITVTLNVTATDPPPAPRSGMDALKFIEYEYNWDSNNWVPVRQTDWLPYATAHNNYPWPLLPTYGIRYMRVWGMDKAGNRSRNSSMDDINLLPSEQVSSVAEGEVNFYRIFVNAGQTLSATLTPITGDPDMYVWGPGNGQPWHNNSSTEVETVQFEAPNTGIYQIELHGHTDAAYRLTFGTTEEAPAVPFRSFQSDSKKVPDGPRVRLDNEPGTDFYDLDPSPPSPQTNTIYLPTIIR